MRLPDCICFIILALLQFNSSGQPQKNLQFNHFNEEHGLPESRYESILQDKKGYIWFGSGNGLIKYDGNTFKTFLHDDFNKNSLGTPNGRQLCNDIRGNFWVAGDGGVSQYDPHNENFIPYWYDYYGQELKSALHDTEYIAALPTAYITCVISDKWGRIWIGTGNGLCFLDSPSAKVVNLSAIIFPDTLCHRSIACLMIDHNGLLWIGTTNGINIYDPVKKKIKLFDPGDKNYTAIDKKVTCMLEDHSNNLWIGLMNTGIYRHNPTTGASKIYRHSATGNNSLASDGVTTLTEDSHSEIWAGMYGGISVYQPATDNFRSYRADAKDKHSLNTNQVEKLFEDRSGAMWIATNGKMNVCYPAANNFFYFQHRYKGYTSSWPSGLYKDHTGKFYMTTFGSGLQEFDPVTGHFKSYFVSLHQSGLTALNYYFGAIETSDGNFWVVGLHEGLHRFDRKTGKFTTIYSTSGDNVSTCMAEDLHKRLWIGTNGGLRCYDLKTKKYSRAEILYPSAPTLPRAKGIGDLYCDKDGILWIATAGGLTIFNTNTGETKDFVQNTRNPHSIISNGVNSFYDDEKGKIWMGTDGGLDVFDKKTQQFDGYTVKEGLPDNKVGRIFNDDNGNLWLSTYNGFCKFTPPSSKNDKAHFRNYNAYDGLPANRFGNNSIKAKDGTFYLGWNEGIVAFRPDELKDNPFVPPVLITGLSVFNKAVVPNDSTGILSLPVDETREIKISYKQNDFSFTFAALNYVHPEKNQYAYKLERYDQDWKYPDATIHFANYTNIDPGEYIFRVKPSNNDGLWNEEGASIKLFITPPYWQTWWFELLCVFAAVVILYSIYNNRVQKLRDILRIRNKIAGDLHDDLGATLSSISIMSELVNQQVKDQSP